MIEFAVHRTGEAEGKGRWVLDTDPVGERLLLAEDDNSLHWVPMAECKLLKAANPDLPRPVVAVNPQPHPKLTVPSLRMNGRGN